MIFQGQHFSTASASKLGQLDIIEIDNIHCKASISLFGGHILNFKPKKDNRERLWLSKSMITDKSKPIRGGVPICWPWFANIFPSSLDTNHNYPAHGFVRTQDWQLIGLEESKENTTLTLVPTQLGLYGFAKNLIPSLKVIFADHLTVRLSTDIGDIDVNNVSEVANPALLTMALHTYLAVSDIDTCELEGVEAQYIDKLDNDKMKKLSPPYRFEGETDRIHPITREDKLESATIKDVAITELSQSGHDALVVWNPWKEKSANMLDMEIEAYRRMLCIEAAIVQPTMVDANSRLELTQIIK